jgi:hypothetical protein
MTATFTKVRGAPTVYRWPDGVVATSLPWTRGLPHDLGHWFIEAQVDLPWGFWSLAGQQAPYPSLTLVSGRWPKGRQEWLDRVRRKHGLAMLHAEAQDGHWLADPTLDVHADWSEIRRLLARTYAFEDSPLARFGPQDVERLRPLALRTAALWEALPPGGSIEVAWPGADDPLVVSSDARGALSLTHREAIRAVYLHRDQDTGEQVTVALDVRPRRRARRR